MCYMQTSMIKSLWKGKMVNRADEFEKYVGNTIFTCNKLLKKNKTKTVPLSSTLNCVSPETESYTREVGISGPALVRSAARQTPAIP